MSEDPIIVKPGLYPELGTTDKEGICVVIDNRGLWDIKHAQDGSTIVTIPANSKWVVMTDDSDGKEKVAIVRRKGTLAKARGEDERRIPYTHADD